MNVGPFTLRELQVRTVELVRESRRRGHKRILVCAPCGFGKTIVSSAVIHSADEKGNSSLFLAGARELIKQKSDKLAQCGVHHSILMAGHQHQISARTVVASKDTLWHRSYRSDRVPKPDGDVIFVDEAHLGNCPTWQAILADYPDATVIGLTATPSLGNGKALPGYDDMVIGATYAELLTRCELVPARVYAPYVVDMSGVTVNPENGEFVQTQVEQRFHDKALVGDVVQQWKKFAEDRTTAVFGSGVPHAISLCHEFNAAGVPAAHIEADTDAAEREDIFGKLEEGTLKVVTNYGVLRVGVDLPFIECLQLAVAMNSLNSFLQTCGRGFRTHTFDDGRRKSDCVIIDHGGNVHKHGWPTEDHDWSLLDDRTVQERDYEIRERKKAPREPICCPVCAAMRDAGPACPNCGHKHQRSGLKLRTVVGELRELPRPKAKKQQQGDESKLWMMCLAVSAHKGMNFKQARVLFRNKTGHWPGNEIRPMPERHQWSMKVRDKYPNFVRRKANT